MIIHIRDDEGTMLCGHTHFDDGDHQWVPSHPAELPHVTCQECVKLYNEQHADEYVCGYAIEFTDGCNPEGVIMHRGSKVECDECMDNLDGVSYSGDRPVKVAKAFVVKAEIYDTFMAGGGSA